jgi:hypothetical protein
VERCFTNYIFVDLQLYVFECNTWVCELCFLKFLVIYMLVDIELDTKHETTHLRQAQLKLTLLALQESRESYSIDFLVYRSG